MERFTLNASRPLSDATRILLMPPSRILRLTALITLAVLVAPGLLK
jgi:hypothetical protein